MKYILLCYHEEQTWGRAGKEAHWEAMQEAVRLTHDLHAKRQYVMASPLEPVSTATSVRVRDGRPLVTDGPFAETREVLGGFYLIDVADLDAALAWAAKVPSAPYGSVEVRPVMIYDTEGAAA